MQTAKDILDTCVEGYFQQKLGLGPEIMKFVYPSKIESHASHYILRPETVESLALLFRFTQDPK